MTNAWSQEVIDEYMKLIDKESELSDSIQCNLKKMQEAVREDYREKYNQRINEVMTEWEQVVKQIDAFIKKHGIIKRQVR